MLNIKGISEQKAEKIFEAASKIESMGFINGLDILEKRKKIKKLSTGSATFDLLLRKLRFHNSPHFRRRSREPIYH
jgi:meiotic recombination protein DMC1